MELQWIRHRNIVAAYYRSANAYSSLCRREFLSCASLTTAEVQIIEHIMEHAEENRNMKWFANRVGISTSAFTNYVNRLVKKGLVEKYHTSENKKDIILRVTELGIASYNDYSAVMEKIFDPLFDVMDRLSEEDCKVVEDMLELWADQHLMGTDKNRSFTLVPVEQK